MCAHQDVTPPTMPPDGIASLRRNGSSFPQLRHLRENSNPTSSPGRHTFLSRPESLRDVQVLTDLVDSRGGCYEHLRKSEQEIREIKKRSVRHFYEKQNEILDTLREVDVILDSRFPAEVMRRFSAIDERSEEIEQNTEEDEALEFQAEVDRRGSLTSRAAQALQWISGQASGSSKRTRETNGNDESDIEESAALVGNKRSGTPVGSTTPANSYGAIGEDEETASTRKGRRSPTQQRMALLAAVPGKGEREEESSRAINFAINVNLAVNVLLLGGKGVAVISSNSVSLIASLVDSALDLLSTVIIFATSKAIAYRSWHTHYKYPVGKKRLEPLGVVIFAVLMIASFVQVLVESVERLIHVVKTGTEGETPADLPIVGVAFMVATIAIKLVMWLWCRTSKSAGVRAVAQDAENDVVFNIASLIFPILGSRLKAPALDPIGGVVLSLYIIKEWVETLTETVTKLSGRVATPEELTRGLYLATRFHSVNAISSFEVYHAGEEVIVEADIVLPHSIALKEAHDLGEIVTYCMESVENVERAYIHLDYNPVGQAGHLGQRG